MVARTKQHLQICQEVGLPDAIKEDIQASEVKKFMNLDDLKQMKCDMAGKGKLEDLMN